jgi:hypothetical protein
LVCYLGFCPSPVRLKVNLLTLSENRGAGGEGVHDDCLFNFISCHQDHFLIEARLLTISISFSKDSLFGLVGEELLSLSSSDLCLELDLSSCLIIFDCFLFSI